DDQVAASRRPAALTRLRRYAGIEPGSRPITELALERMRERLSDKNLLGPSKTQVETDLSRIGFLLDGTAKLFEKYGLDAKEPMARLRTQVDAYTAALKAELLPRCRTDFRLPPELYAFQLKGFGVTIPPADLAARAHASFLEIRNEMKAI